MGKKELRKHLRDVRSWKECLIKAVSRLDMSGEKGCLFRVRKKKSEIFCDV